MNRPQDYLQLTLAVMLGFCYALISLEEKNMPENKYTGASKLSVRVSGTALNAETGYELEAVITSLQSVENLVKKTYLAAYDRARFTDNDADNVSINLMAWRKGSLWSDLQINYRDVILPTIGFVAENKEFVWEIIKDSTKFLRTKLKAEKEGKSVQVKQTSKSGVNISATDGGTVIITVPEDLPKIAEQLQGPLENLTQQVDGKKVSSIDLTNGTDTSEKKTEKITLDVEDKATFGSATFTSNDEVEIRGKIVSGNFETNTGRIEVISSSVRDIEVGISYRLRISKDLHAEEKWKEMFLTPRPYYCKYTLGGPNRDKVTEIIITDWNEADWENAG